MTEQGVCPSEDEMQAEEEIGRLQAVNRDLLAALKAMVAAYPPSPLHDDPDFRKECEGFAKWWADEEARAAIEKAES